MSATHTKGIIRVKFDGHIINYVGEPYCSLVVDNVSSQLVPVPIAKEVRMSNARRLAACWNACDQLDTDHIESIAEVGVASVIVTADIHRKDCEAALRELAAARALLTELSDTEMLRHDMHVRISAFLKGQP